MPRWPVVLSGWSAGPSCRHDDRSPHVAAGLAISGVYDLAPIRDTGLNNALKLTDQESRHFRRSVALRYKTADIAYGTAEPRRVSCHQAHEMRVAAGAPA